MTRSKYITTALGAAAALWMASSAVHADTVSDLGKCRFDSRQKVVDCCRAVVTKYGKPQWMRESGANCSSAVVCVAAADSKVVGAKVKQRRCYIKKRVKQPDNGGPDHVPHVPDVPGTPQNPTHG